MTKPVSSPFLSIIIPALNEEKRIGSTLDELAIFLREEKIKDCEIIVVIADSSDRTVEVTHDKLANYPDARIIQSGPIRGKGYQVRIGMLDSKGKYRLFMDADLATPLIHIKDALDELEKGADGVIALRDLTKIHTGIRKYISIFTNIFCRVILWLPYSDTQCGFKAFEGTVAEQVFRRQTINGWIFDMEILTVAKALGKKISGIKVNDWHDVPDSKFQAVGLKDAFSTFVDIISIRLNLIRGIYK